MINLNQSRININHPNDMDYSTAVAIVYTALQNMDIGSKKTVRVIVEGYTVESRLTQSGNLSFTIR